MWISDQWQDFELIDCSEGEKLERWGDFFLIRPDPQAIWATPRTDERWNASNARYRRSETGGGSWSKARLPESWQIRYLAREIQAFKLRYPGLHYHITSGDTEQVTEKLDKGLLDFAVICETPDSSRYDHLSFPESDTWGAVMAADHPLAAKKEIRAKDLIGQPLFCSEQSWNNEIPAWAGSRFPELTLEGSFRLSYNGAMFAKEGLGVLLTFRNIIFCGGEDGLVFRPLYPGLETKQYLIWNRYQRFTPIAERFLAQIRAAFGETP